jgi:hypothetical protein
MKKRVDSFIEEEVIRKAKRLAAEEGRSLGEVIHDALVLYLSTKVPEQGKRLKAYKLFCEQPIRIGREKFREIMEADTYE